MNAYQKLTELADSIERLIPLRRAEHGRTAAWGRQLKAIRTKQLRMEVAASATHRPVGARLVLR